MSKVVLVTGATGFVGNTLCGQLAAAGYTVRAALRTDRSMPAGVVQKVVVGEIGARTEWLDALKGVDRVLHVAARAHVLADSPDNAEKYIECNARGTIRLAEQAAAAGVGRFVFLSSVKVNGEDSGEGLYRSDDTPAPLDMYGRSKAMAEEGLQAVAARTGLQVASVRSPLVYGPGVRANFLRLLHWVNAQRPLPLGAIRNRRSLVSVWNLCSLLTRTLDHPGASGTWMVSDGEDMSTPELVRRIGCAMQRRALLLPVPVALMHVAGTLLGKQAEIKRLCGSLAVDISATRQRLDWTPVVSVNEALERTVHWYLGELNARAS
jgi:UDP-glucose 4-epimerase